MTCLLQIKSQCKMIIQGIPHAGFECLFHNVLCCVMQQIFAFPMFWSLMVIRKDISVCACMRVQTRQRLSYIHIHTHPHINSMWHSWGSLWVSFIPPTNYTKSRAAAAASLSLLCFPTSPSPSVSSSVLPLITRSPLFFSTKIYPSLPH